MRTLMLALLLLLPAPAAAVPIAELVPATLFVPVTLSVPVTWSEPIPAPEPPFILSAPVEAVGWGANDPTPLAQNPEPATLTLTALTLAAWGVWRRRCAG